MEGKGARESLKTPGFVAKTSPKTPSEACWFPLRYNIKKFSQFYYRRVRVRCVRSETAASKANERITAESSLQSIGKLRSDSGCDVRSDRGTRSIMDCAWGGFRAQCEGGSISRELCALGSVFGLRRMRAVVRRATRGWLSCVVRIEDRRENGTRKKRTWGSAGEGCAVLWYDGRALPETLR